MGRNIASHYSLNAYCIALSVLPSCSVLGRPIVVYGSGAQSGHVLGCANIEPSVVAEEEIEISFPRNATNPEDIDKVLLKYTCRMNRST